MSAARAGSRGTTGSRLLIVVRAAESYGVATKLATVARGLAARGWKVTVYAFGEGDFPTRVQGTENVECVHVSATPQRFVADGTSKLRAYARLLVTSTRFIRVLRAFLRHNGFDALVFAEHGLVLPIGLAMARTGVPAFFLMPNIISDDYPLDLNRRVYAAVFRFSGMVPVANSTYTRSTLGRAGRRAEQIVLGIDPARFLAPANGQDPLSGSVPADAVRVGVIARLVPEKGQLTLLRALFADEGLRRTHLVLCGGPVGTPYEAELRSEAARLGAADRLHLLGPVQHVEAYLNALDIVANVRLDPEPFGLAIVEAMLAGRPVLAHAAGGPADIVIDGETGWLLQDMSSETLSQGLARAMRDQGRWGEMGAAGRRRALERYTAETMTEQLERIIERAAAPPSDGRRFRVTRLPVQ